MKLKRHSGGTYGSADARPFIRQQIEKPVIPPVSTDSRISDMLCQLRYAVTQMQDIDPCVVAILDNLEQAYSCFDDCAPNQRADAVVVLYLGVLRIRSALLAQHDHFIH